MFHSVRPKIKLIASAMVLIACGVVPADRVLAKDFFVTVGGGYGPTSNQVSLERNVIFFQRVLARHYPEGPEHFVLFSDGEDSRRDVQYRANDVGATAAERILAEVLGDPDELSLKYRNHQIDSVQSAARLLSLRRHLVRVGREAQPGDRVFIYVTAHGGSSDDEQNKHNTVLHLWGDDQLTASEFSQLLDRIPQHTQVVLVMVQCHAGGFAHVMFDRADPELGLSSRLRCGFFSQDHRRAAAGCTADVNEEDYQEYSSFFWAALGGETRTGQPLERVDYDQDGLTSLAEAHAYAVIQSDTVDIPLRTSDAFLLQYSRVAKQKKDDSAMELVDDEPSPLKQLFRRLTPQEQRVSQTAKLRPLAGTMEQLAEAGAPVDRAILIGLAAKLQIPLDTDVQDLKSQIRAAKRAVKRAESQQATALLRYLEVRSDVREAVHREWPELEGTITPTLTALLAGQDDQLNALVQSLDDYRVLIKAREKVEQCAEETLAAERHEAKLQRLQRTARRIVLERNLPQAAPADVVTHYARLLEAEGAPLSVNPISP